MGPFTAFLVLTFCLHQSLGDDPAFPSFSGDVRISGYVLLGMYPEMRATFWWSDSRKAARQDVKNSGISIRQIALESQGQYGTTVKMVKKDGETQCTFTKGTAEKPVKYKSFLSSFENRTLVGKTTVDGKVIYEWKFNNEGHEGVLYVRQDETGPVPIRMTVGKNFTLLISHISSTTVSPYLFSYNQNECTEVKETWKQGPIKDLLTVFRV